METCRCDENREAVKNYAIWTIGGIHPFEERLEVPPEARVAWIKNKANYDDMRPYKPFIRTTVKRSICAEQPKTDQIVPNKWIPVLPGLISQRLVNESKGVTDRPF